MFGKRRIAVRIGCCTILLDILLAGGSNHADAATDSGQDTPVMMSILLGGIPIWNTVSSLRRSAWDRSCNGAPKRSIARITAFAFSGEGITHRSKAADALRYPCTAMA